jgi:hypothetical protein
MRNTNIEAFVFFSEFFARKYKSRSPIEYKKAVVAMIDLRVPPPKKRPKACKAVVRNPY